MEYINKLCKICTVGSNPAGRSGLVDLAISKCVEDTVLFAICAKYYINHANMAAKPKRLQRFGICKIFLTPASSSFESDPDQLPLNLVGDLVGLANNPDEAGFLNRLNSVAKQLATADHAAMDVKTKLGNDSAILNKAKTQTRKEHLSRVFAEYWQNPQELGLLKLAKARKLYFGNRTPKTFITPVESLPMYPEILSIHPDI